MQYLDSGSASRRWQSDKSFGMNYLWQEQPPKQPSREPIVTEHPGLETRLALNPPKQPVAVLMAVRFQLLCFLLRLTAIEIIALTPSNYNRLCRLLRSCATRCKMAENRLKIRRSLRSWGFDPPSRHQCLSGFSMKMASRKRGPLADRSFGSANGGKHSNPNLARDHSG